MVQFNFGQGAQGALGGAGAGFAAGGPFGAGLGGLAGLFSGFGGGGTAPSNEQLPNMDPQQQNLLNQIMQLLGGEGQLGQGSGEALSNLRELMDPSSEAQQRFADPYMQQFQQQTIPELGERYAGAGATGGALSSSGFGQAIGGAGAQLQSQLASLKSQLQSGAGKDILAHFQNLLGQGLQAQPFSYLSKPGTPGFGTSLLQGFAQGGGAQQVGQQYQNRYGKKE